MNKAEVAEMAQIKQKVDDLDENLTKHITEQRQDFDKIFTKLDKMGGAFANKWVEKAFIGLLITITSGVIIYLATRGV